MLCQSLCSSCSHLFVDQLFTDIKDSERFVRNILYEQMENVVFFCLFSKFVCVLHDVVTLVEGQIASINKVCTMSAKVFSFS